MLHRRLGRRGGGRGCELEIEGLGLRLGFLDVCGWGNGGGWAKGEWGWRDGGDGVRVGFVRGCWGSGGWDFGFEGTMSVDMGLGGGAMEDWLGGRIGVGSVERCV